MPDVPVSDSPVHEPLSIEPCSISAHALHAAAVQSLRSHPHIVRDRLAYLRSHRGALDRVLRNSYWHCNGFAKIRVLRSDSLSLRLHVWEAGTDRVGDVDPHAHRWDFASWIAVGPGVGETIFKEVGNDTADRRLLWHSEVTEYARYDYGRDVEGSHLRSPRTSALIPVERRSHHVGAVYGCPVGTVHTVRPIGHELVATVVLQGPAVVDVNAVYRPMGQQFARVEERSMTAGELQGLLSHVEAVIQTSSAD